MVFANYYPEFVAPKASDLADLARLLIDKKMKPNRVGEIRVINVTTTIPSSVIRSPILRNPIFGYLFDLVIYLKKYFGDFFDFLKLFDQNVVDISLARKSVDRLSP